MGLRDILFGSWDSTGPDLINREDAPSRIDALLSDIIEQRRSAFSIEQARALPAVARSLSLLSGISASFLPLVYRNGTAMPSQPRITQRPDPFATRYEHVAQTVLGLAEEGCSYWRLGDPDPSSGKPRFARVLPHAEVTVEWDSRKVFRVYTWRGMKLREGTELLHLTINRRPGELHGRGPLREGLDKLYPVWEAEEFAASFFTSGGVPEVVIKAATQLTADEAQELKDQWVKNRRGAEPAVLGLGVSTDYPGVDPQRAQLQEARSFGATIAATMFGIPAAMLHVQTSGATITYTNPAGALEELVKSTIAPIYLTPLEAAWSDLVPSPGAVRFDLADMQRADIAARFDLYRKAQGNRSIGLLPWMTIDEIRANEGWGPLGEVDAQDNVHQFDPSPAQDDAVPVEVPSA